MGWKEISVNHLLIKNYSFLSEIGILDYIESIKIENKELEGLIADAYNISTKKSIDEIVAYMIECLSDIFIPSDLLIIVNEGVIVDKLKIMAFKNLKSTEINMDLKSLEPYENFFRNHLGTIEYSTFESDIVKKELLIPFKKIDTKLIIPIVGHSGLYGLILFGPKILYEDYSEHEISYIDRLMKFISVGIQNNLYYNHSVKDAKTGLYNHIFFIKRINEEFSRSKRQKIPFSVVLIDIDNFKKFNDKYGHLAGDAVINSIAETLKHELREMDTVSRFGGEEFTILLPDTKGSIAMNIAERVRKSVENLTVLYMDKELKVTISLGLSLYNYVENIDANELLKRADEAMYKSKDNGRNRVTAYKSGLLYRANTLQI